jgi:hypothetical protein
MGTGETSQKLTIPSANFQLTFPDGALASSRQLAKSAMVERRA